MDFIQWLSVQNGIRYVDAVYECAYQFCSIFNDFFLPFQFHKRDDEQQYYCAEFAWKFAPFLPHGDFASYGVLAYEAVFLVSSDPVFRNCGF